MPSAGCNGWEGVECEESPLGVATTLFRSLDSGLRLVLPVGMKGLEVSWLLENGVGVTTETVGRPMEILLIEDSLMSAKLAAQAVRGRPFDHRLTWLSDGQEALSFLLRKGCYARAPKPDLVLLDLQLPGCSGVDILRRMQSDPGLTQVPVVVLTAETQHLGEELACQVQGCLTKPFPPEAFQELLRKLRGHWRTGMLRGGPLPEDTQLG